jgi:hypothetical protein
MLSQLRRYRVRTDDWDEFVALVFNHIVPVREALGFRVDGVWGDREDGTFVWVVTHEAPEGWEAAERAYYESPARAELPRDPRDFLLEVDTKVLQPLTAP